MKIRLVIWINTEFIIACLLNGLEYIHHRTILHRDIKPENLVFDEYGYIRITDFGISRIWSPKNENDTSGTPGYMAPEVMMKQGHGIACDLFAVGVIAYECVIGKVLFII
jgi:serine/threonine protein kinase